MKLRPINKDWKGQRKKLVRYEIGIVGSGGQGVVLLGTILAQAAASVADLFVAQTRSYDPAVRGGKAESNLVLSDEEIDYPGVLGYDLLLALSQEGCDRNIERLKKEALLVVDSGLVKKVIWSKILKIPFTKIARQKFNDERVTNMIALGALTRLCEYIPSSAVEASISANFKGDALKLNLNSFREGIEYTARRLKFDFERVDEEEIEI
ncbi:MAG: 2-oxoacid:ferredoxin oxidoreductase subunit gamma [Dehalococcoidia bacterium]|nr:2-oxoacid:ferredoxin oxidoreductase subunit gamma [Dehalococcoidia bacterium]